MKDQDIVFFNKEWGQEATSADHVFWELARNNRCLWVNSVATRNPNLTSAQDWGRILAKIRKLVGGLRQLGPTSWLYQPFFIPLPYSPITQRLNRWLLRTSIRRVSRRLKMCNPQLWTCLPTTAFIAGQLGESVLVYYCVDNWSEFAHLEASRILPLENELLAKADICFATSVALVEHLGRRNPNTHLSRHGVDWEKFGLALAPSTRVPNDVASLPKPVIGFFGAIDERIDVPVLDVLARSHPEWSLALLGRVQMDVSLLQALPNVHFLGRKPYEELPAYCKGFDLGIIPYVRNEFTRHVNPIKLRQYLSAGLPVVSTALPEVMDYGNLVSIASTPAEFVQMAERELANDSPSCRGRRREALRSETWETKVKIVCDLVEEAIRARGARCTG